MNADVRRLAPGALRAGLPAAAPAHPSVRARLGFVMLALALSVACGKDETPAPTTTTPTVTLTTETFNGTVAIRGSAFHTFNVAQTGAVNVTLTAAGPPSTINMGLGVGVPKDSACSLLQGASTNAQAASTPQLSGTSSAGQLCVEVRDIGNQTAPVTYTLTVAHP